MAELSWPWDGSSAGDAGPYSAADDARHHRYMIGHDLDEANRGVMLGPGDSLAVVASSPAAKSVVVKAGAALANGHLYTNTGDLTLTIDDNSSGYTRVDRVVLEVDYAAQTVRAVVVKGPEDGSAAPAALVRSASYFQVTLARVTLASGFATVTDAGIADDRYYGNLPGVVAPELDNGSGAEVDAGTVVALDDGADRSFDTSATVGDLDVIGAAMERIPAAGHGKIATAGVVLVKVTGAVSRGDYLAQSATPGVAQASPYGFAVALTGNPSGLGAVWALLKHRSPVESAERDICLSSGYATIGDDTWQSLGPIHYINASAFKWSNVYWDICVYCNAGLTTYVRLLLNSVPIATLSTTSTSMVRLRSAELSASLATGTYTIEWRKSGDGHGYFSHARFVIQPR